jgi:hypothetical protein
MAISLEQGREPNWGRTILKWLETVVEPGDLVVTFSNGSFGGLISSLRETH